MSLQVKQHDAKKSSEEVNISQVKLMSRLTTELADATQRNATGNVRKNVRRISIGASIWARFLT